MKGRNENNLFLYARPAPTTPADRVCVFESGTARSVANSTKIIETRRREALAHT